MFGRSKCMYASDYIHQYYPNTFAACIYMYICMYKYVCIYVCICICMYVCIYNIYVLYNLWEVISKFSLYYSD